MNTYTKLIKGVEERLRALRVFPASDGSDTGIMKESIERAHQRVLFETGFSELPDELIGAVVDLAAADTAEHILASGSTCGTVSSRSDGTYSVKYRDGSSRDEKLDELIVLLRESGKSRICTYRRLRW